MADLFSSSKSGARGKESKGKSSYSAKDIEVLEGLEPVRRRPGMYIGGTDETALHHLAAEMLDNAMDEAVAGHASRIEMSLAPGNWLTVRDNGRGIPVDPHPKFKNKSALEVILTTLHSGGKFSARSTRPRAACTASASRWSTRCPTSSRSRSRATRSCGRRPTPRQAHGQAEEPGRRQQPARHHDPLPARPGDLRRKRPHFRPARLYRMARSKAYLYRGVEIRWRCDPTLLGPKDDDAGGGDAAFPGRPGRFPRGSARRAATADADAFAGEGKLANGGGTRAASNGRWPGRRTAKARSDPTATPSRRPRAAPTKRACAPALTKGAQGLRRAGRQPQGGARSPPRTSWAACCAAARVFIRDPQFQGQTKEKLPSPDATRLVEKRRQGPFRPLAVRRRRRPPTSCWNALIERAEDAPAPQARARTVTRKTATRKLRLPGKLADCSAARRTAPRSSWSRATRPAARPSRRATAPPRRCCPCAARSSTSPARRRQAARQPGTLRPDAGARLRHRHALSTTTSCATSASSS